MIFVGLGANLEHPEYGPPAETLEAACARIDSENCRISARSAHYRTAPVPVSDQPWYINQVIGVETALEPAPLMDFLHAIEDEFGRSRPFANAPRVLDLDLLAYDARRTGPDGYPVLPHPRLTRRAFVLLPLQEICPDWRHPVTGVEIGEIIAALPAVQPCEKL